MRTGARPTMAELRCAWCEVELAPADAAWCDPVTGEVDEGENGVPFCEGCAPSTTTVELVA
jgi:hypothetical protein